MLRLQQQWYFGTPGNDSPRTPFAQTFDDLEKLPPGFGPGVSPAQFSINHFVHLYLIVTLGDQRCDVRSF